MLSPEAAEWAGSLGLMASAAISQSVGQLLIPLFVARSPRAAVLSQLGRAATAYVLTWLGWAALIRILVPGQLAFEDALMVASAGSAPFVFGAVVLTPWFGQFVEVALPPVSLGLAIWTATNRLEGGLSLTVLPVAFGWLGVVAIHRLIKRSQLPKMT